MQTDPGLEAYWEASKALDYAYSSMAKACGLSEPEYWSLAMIHRGMTTQRAICRELCISPQTIHSAFKLLVRKGLISLEPLPQDQRSKQAVLTAAGERFVTEQILPTEKLEEQAWQALSPGEQRDLVRLTRLYSAALRRTLRLRKDNPIRSSEGL